MKKCTVCGNEKDTEEFYKAAKMKDGLQSCCKKCANAQNVAAMHKKPEKYAVIRRKEELRLRKRFFDWKRSIGCVFCSECEPVCLELHHKNPRQKDIQPNKLRTYAWETLMKEARKCIMVCSNCHKKIHAGLLDASNKATIT